MAATSFFRRGLQTPWSLRLWRIAVLAAVTTLQVGAVDLSAANAASGDEVWVSVYNGPSDYIDVAYAVAVGPDGSTVFATGESANPGSGYDYYTAAYDSASGSLLWHQTYNGPGNDEDAAKLIGVSPDGSTIFVSGYSVGSGTGKDYATLAYEAASGTVLWARRYDGPGNGEDLPWALAVSPDGGEVFVSGGSLGSGTDDDYATVAYDAATGHRIWAKRYNAPGGGYDWVRAIAPSPDGRALFVTGGAIGTDGYQQFGTVAYDASNGRVLWTDSYDWGHPGNDLPAAIAVSPDGRRVFVTGYGSGTLTLDDFQTVAYAAGTGVKLWTARFDGPGHFWDEAYDLGVSPDGTTVFVTGSVMKGMSQESRDYATLAYDAPTGTVRWSAGYNGSGNGKDIPFKLSVSPDGGRVYVTGTSKGVPKYQYDWLTLSYDAYLGGTPLWTSRVSGNSQGWETPNSMAVSTGDSRLYVSGYIINRGTSDDFATVAYET